MKDLKESIIDFEKGVKQGGKECWLMDPINLSQEFYILIVINYHLNNLYQKGDNL